MGLQGKGIDAGNGASVLVIDQACDNDQLLVSLSKNGQKWLSPVGWTDQQKVTLLDCRLQGETTQIDVPAEFAKDIKSGDVLVLRCSELDFETEITWEASEIETRNTKDAAPAVTSLAGGLLSRFKNSKAETVVESKSEAELRAEEADRAAQGYKAKMEAATAAKEDAQRKALEAAREAEAALKMEAERIAEMERAAKAFEEAERLKQDELRRVEEERRAEEARLAEEARRIEEARKREIAAKKDAERKAALERYEAALDITRNEEVHLKSRLKDLRGKAKSDASNIAVQREDLQSRQGLLVASEDATAKRLESYEKTASKLNELNADLSSMQTESDALTADREALSIRLSQADADYQQAQKEAEAAIAKAEARRKELDVIRQEEGDVSEKILSVSETLASQNQKVTDTTERTHRLHSKLDAAQAELAQAKVEIEALQGALALQVEQEQNLRLEIEATQQAIEDSQAREAAYIDAIEHLQAGGAPEDIANIDFEPRNFEASSMSSDGELEPFNTIISKSPSKSRKFGRGRRSFARGKDAEISIEVEDIVLDASEEKADPVLLAELDDTPSFIRRHSSSLMALGAVIGGIAILSGGLALNKSAKPELEVKSSTPAPTQVAGKVSKVELPKPVETTMVVAPSETVGTKPEEVALEQPLSTIDAPKIEMVEILPTNIDIPETKIDAVKANTETTIEAAKIETDILIQEVKTPTELEADAFIVKLAEVVEPTGFAFELPDMRPIAEPKKAETTTEPKKIKTATPTLKKSPPKRAETKKAIVVKTAARAKSKAKSVSTVDADVNYPELTSDVQTRLSNLGFYTGDIDGLQGKATKQAIKEFKTLFSMPETNHKITGALLTELKRAERDQEAAAVQAQAHAEAAKVAAEAQAAIQMAEAAPSVTFYDTVQAVPSTPVIADTLPAANAFAPVMQAAPTYIAPEPAPVRVASIPATIYEPAPTPAAQDVIVEAEVLKNASAKYPSTALRRSYLANVAIVVGYDIDTSGRATNLTIASNDHSGRYNESFEKEAINAIKRLRYSPKTVNGVAVESKGQQKRIVFKAE